jgi:uncharacterized protein YhbP (UPF0306 family)
MTFSASGEGWVLREFEDLLQITTMALATTGEGGEPHSASVFFAADERLFLHFFSDPGSQHSVDLAREPRAAVTFYPEDQRWQEIRGLQMRGAVYSTRPGPDWEHAWRVYSAKFPFVTELKDVVARNQFYAFVPGWIRLVDNRRGFGYKEEWVRGPGTGTGAGVSPWRPIKPEEK